jgi:hypothetical protein
MGERDSSAKKFCVRDSKVHLLLSEIPTPAWQDIVMDRAAWNKMLRSIYTN